MSKLIVTADVGNTVNLRRSPSLTSEIIMRVKVKEEVTLIEKISENWCKVEYDNKEGYMMAKYLKSSSKTISQEDLRKVYDSLRETLTLIEKILK